MMHTRNWLIQSVKIRHQLISGVKRPTGDAVSPVESTTLPDQLVTDRYRLKQLVTDRNQLDWSLTDIFGIPSCRSFQTHPLII